MDPPNSLQQMFRRYWGLVRELQRLRAIEEERRLAWEVRIRATREKMIAVR